MGLFEFKLPDIGEGIHEGEIVKWFVKAGDTVKEDDVLLEVQNDKAVVEIPSPVDGTVKEVKVDEGVVAVVGDVLITFEVEGEGSAPSEEAEQPKAEDNAKDVQDTDQKVEDKPNEVQTHVWFNVWRKRDCRSRVGLFGRLKRYRMGIWRVFFVTVTGFCNGIFTEDPSKLN